MDDWKHIAAANMVRLRKASGMTQLQLAEQLHYSDKAVSKWERGESLPDLAVMKQLADFYGIRIDDFLKDPDAPAETPAEAEPLAEIPEIPAEQEPQEAEPAQTEPPVDVRLRKRNRFLIAGMAALPAPCASLLSTPLCVSTSAAMCSTSSRRSFASATCPNTATVP